jgi:hypothetical protein
VFRSRRRYRGRSAGRDRLRESRASRDGSHHPRSRTHGRGRRGGIGDAAPRVLHQHGVAGLGGERKADVLDANRSILGDGPRPDGVRREASRSDRRTASSEGRDIHPFEARSRPRTSNVRRVPRTSSRPPSRSAGRSGVPSRIQLPPDRLPDDAYLRASAGNGRPGQFDRAEPGRPRRFR